MLSLIISLIGFALAIASLGWSKTILKAFPAVRIAALSGCAIGVWLCCVLIALSQL